MCESLCHFDQNFVRKLNQQCFVQNLALTVGSSLHVIRRFHLIYNTYFSNIALASVGPSLLTAKLFYLCYILNWCSAGDMVWMYIMCHGGGLCSYMYVIFFSSPSKTMQSYLYQIQIQPCINGCRSFCVVLWKPCSSKTNNTTTTSFQALWQGTFQLTQCGLFPLRCRGIFSNYKGTLKPSVFCQLIIAKFGEHSFIWIATIYCSNTFPTQHLSPFGF